MKSMHNFKACGNSSVLMTLMWRKKTLYPLLYV